MSDQPKRMHQQPRDHAGPSNSRPLAVPIALCALFCAALSTVTGATLTLAQQGAASGFTLTTFATVFPGHTGNMGPFGVAVASNGNVLVSIYASDTRYVFRDADGQTLGTALGSVTPSGTQSIAYAHVGGKAFGGVYPQFAQFNSDGTVNHVLTGVSQSPWFGMWGNQITGHILSTTGQGQIIDIDPNANGGTGSARVVASPGLGYDGVTVSPDGSIVYVVQGNHIIGYNIASGAQVSDSGPLAGGPDGIAVISSTNSLNGQIVVNFNGPTIDAGFVGLLDPTTNVVTTIASGGTRGDYIAPDPSNGSVFLDYSDIVYRLSCGPNCVIGSSPYAGAAQNGASFSTTQPLAPGGLFSIFGTGLVLSSAEASSIPLPLSLGNVSVTIANIPAPLLFVSMQQINLQVPWNIPSGPVDIVVTVNGVASGSFRATAGALSPGIFSTQYGSGQAFAINPDGSLAGSSGSVPGFAAHPAHPGDTILVLATGLGAVTPSIATGASASDGLRNTVTTPTVLIGNKTAQLSFSGLSPQFVGVNQLNVVVPDLPAGVYALQLSEGGTTTTNQATIAIANP